MNMTISLPDELADFVKAKISSGTYTSSSDVVREALGLTAKFESMIGKAATVAQGVAGGNLQRRCR